jgi:hypothetical protein
MLTLDSFIMQCRRCRAICKCGEMSYKYYEVEKIPHVQSCLCRVASTPTADDTARVLSRHGLHGPEHKEGPGYRVSTYTIHARKAYQVTSSIHPRWSWYGSTFPSARDTERLEVAKLTLTLSMHINLFKLWGCLGCVGAYVKPSTR